MLIPLEWLRDYIDIEKDICVSEFCEKMTMSGSKVESVETFGDMIENIPVGKILNIEKHRDADKLLVCQVDVGRDKPAQVVTGADNVFVGAFVPVALHGSRVPGPLHGKPKQEGGTVIVRGKIRGVESDGMLCSASELGFADKVVPLASRDGIWILNGEYEPGCDITEALGLSQTTVDFEITPNRPDCLSMLGMARETGAVYMKSFRYPETCCEGEAGEAADYISVEIKKPELCGRYAARVVKDVKVGQSPWWLQKRLMHAGMRPINNIVDITNFVMLEYGEPIHAFDIRQISGNKIVVDTAADGEPFTTLDGSVRTLSKDMLLIKDSERAIAVAGVMGGLNSEIEDDTDTIVIEAANFNMDSVRATSRKLALRTEASSRFEKGIDPNLCRAATDRVCKLIQILGAGTVVGGAVDIYPIPQAERTIDVRVARVNSILGIEMSGKAMAEIFESLEMKVSGDDKVLKVTPPTIRGDLAEEIDFVEETARIYGYDKLPDTMPKGSLEAKKTRERTLKDLAKDIMCAMGADEIQTYSFVSPSSVDNIRLGRDVPERRFVKIINPLGEENSVMRTILTPNMVEALGRNFSRNNQRVRAFELGNTFVANAAGDDGLPVERDSMAIGLYGQGESFFTLKGMVEELFSGLGVRDVKFIQENAHGAYHPGRCARILSGETELGIMGEVHPDVAEGYGVETRCYCCELMFDEVMRLADTEKLYRPLPKYPQAVRDIALIVDEDTAAGALLDIIRSEGGDILETVYLFDVYRGKQIDEGKKSAAFSLTYRAPDRTLTEEELVEVHGRIIKALQDRAKAILRDI